MINKTLAILAGGKSSRMNYNDKAFLNYKEKMFIEHIIKAGNSYKEIIIIANNKEKYKKFGLRIIEDIYVGNGPLSGIHAALNSASTEYVLCVACDMPLISKELLDYIGEYEGNYEVLVPKSNDRLQPLCSIYNKSILSKIEKALENNENKLQKFIKGLNYQVVDGFNYRKFEDKDFLNINTPDEFKELEEL